MRSWRLSSPCSYVSRSNTPSHCWRIGHWRRRKNSRPLRPTKLTVTFTPRASLSRRNSPALRKILALNAPQRPRSLVTTRTSMLRAARFCNSGWAARFTRRLRSAMTSRILCPYGLAARMRSCARLSLAAATIFMALVIFWVFLTEPILRRRACRLGMEGFQRRSRLCAISYLPFERGDDLLQLGTERLVDFSLGDDVLLDLRVVLNNVM